MTTKMTKTEAKQWVRNHADDDRLDDEELEAAFAALFGRKADEDDRAEGLWSHCCSAIES